MRIKFYKYTLLILFFNHFTWIVKQYNNSDDGVYLVNTGKDDISKVNLIEKWNSKP